MPSVFSITRTVEFCETDMAGIMHFSNYFRWMEACEATFYRSLQLPLISFVPGSVVGWPRVKASCDYKAPLRFNDVLEVKLFIKELRTKGIVYVFQFRKVEAGVVQPLVLAQGEMAAVCVTSDPTGKMIAQPIPEAVRALLSVADPAAYAN
jgi:YbgC/YbaW family acyl-CoA thioester hydrolase